MLSKLTLATILGLPIDALNDCPEQFSGIDWKTQGSNEETILFYKIGNKDTDESVFWERIQNTNYGLLVLNSKPKKQLPAKSVVISEDSWPDLQKKILDFFFPVPKDLKMIAVTGTNGKTTTTDLILQLGEQCGKKGLSLGTLGVRENGKTLEDFGLTSPSLIDLRKYIHRFGQHKDFCVMEVSSHALSQKRIHGLEFSVAAWPSFSQDHLDYHQTMESYFEAKCLLFNYLKPHASLYIPENQAELWKKLHPRFEQAKLAKKLTQKMPLFFSTKFNRENLEIAVSVIEDAFGEHYWNFEGLQAPDGRFYIRSYKSNYIVVDFAHTPDALENICQGIRESFPNHKLKVLFGCGGDRDRRKRPLMAEAVDKFADYIYVTSDNPRTENPDQIISDVIVGIKKNQFETITERPVAVKKAFSELNENEVLLLAGKGHEDYILINGVKHPYSDIREVDQFLK